MEKQEKTNKILMDYCRLIRICCSILGVFAVLCILAGCNDSSHDDVKGKELRQTKTFVLTDSTRAAMEKISQYKILFGHHSVGDNILAGLQMLAEETGVVIKVVPLDEGVAIKEPGFYHFYPGRNTRPKTKIDSFVRFFNGREIGVDIACMKFCFVDFTPDTNVKKIMEYYKKNIDQLQRKYPDVTFVHCTVPLTAKSNSFKDTGKRFFGLQVWGDASNEVRGRYNEMLFKTFPKDTIFDLARAESTRRDGSRVGFAGRDGKVFALAPEYTNDGGHLNDLGRRVAASAMAEFLARALGSPGH